MSLPIVVHRCNEQERLAYESGISPKEKLGNYEQSLVALRPVYTMQRGLLICVLKFSAYGLYEIFIPAGILKSHKLQAPSLTRPEG